MPVVRNQSENSHNRFAIAPCRFGMLFLALSAAHNRLPRPRLSIELFQLDTFTARYRVIFGSPMIQPNRGDTKKRTRVVSFGATNGRILSKILRSPNDHHYYLFFINIHFLCRSRASKTKAENDNISFGNKTMFLLWQTIVLVRFLNSGNLLVFFLVSASIRFMHMCPIFIIPIFSESFLFGFICVVFSISRKSRRY